MSQPSSDAVSESGSPSVAARPDAGDRRRHRRFRVALPGRYMLEDGEEHPCECVDISASGMRLRAPKAGPWGSRVVAYIDGIGRVEGRLIRRAPGWFAIATRANHLKEERVEGRIAGLLDGVAATPSASVAPAVALEDANGRRFAATLGDLTLEGASVLTQGAFRPGEAVWLAVWKPDANVVEYLPAPRSWLAGWAAAAAQSGAAAR